VSKGFGLMPAQLATTVAHAAVERPTILLTMVIVTFLTFR
jgi:hypothetical protein